MTDMTELDAAWAEAPTRLIAAELGTREDDRVALVAAARLRELDAENRDLYERNGELNDRVAASAPAPVAAPAGDWPPVVTEDMISAVLRPINGFISVGTYRPELKFALREGITAVFASLPRPAPAKDCTIPSPTPGQFLMDAADRRIADLNRQIANLRRTQAILLDKLTAPAVAPEPPAAVVPWVPKGWKLVPVDQTDEMADAAREAHETGADALGWYAALDAAPPPPPMPAETPAALLDRLQAMIQDTHPGATVAVVPVGAKVVRPLDWTEGMAEAVSAQTTPQYHWHAAAKHAPDARVAL